MALVGLGVDETLGFFATAQCAWIAWLQSCKVVDTDEATQECMAAFKAARDAHAPAIVEWACLFMREHCFRGDILELLNGLRDLKHRGCVAKVALFSSKANVFGWVDLVHAVLSKGGHDGVREKPSGAWLLYRGYANLPPPLIPQFCR